MAIKKTASVAFLAVFSLIILIGGIYFLRQDVGKMGFKNLLHTQSTASSSEVLYLLNYGDKGIKQYKLVANASSTVFSLLQDISQKENFKIDFQVYPEMGVFVKSIDEVANGQDNKYWQYWVNDALGEVASDKKAVKAEDKIEWKFDFAPNF